MKDQHTRVPNGMKYSIFLKAIPFQLFHPQTCQDDMLLNCSNFHEMLV